MPRALHHCLLNPKGMDNRSIRVLHVSWQIRSKPSLRIHDTNLERCVLKSDSNLIDRQQMERTFKALPAYRRMPLQDKNRTDSKLTLVKVQSSLLFLLHSLYQSPRGTYNFRGRVPTTSKEKEAEGASVIVSFRPPPR